MRISTHFLELSTGRQTGLENASEVKLRSNCVNLQKRTFTHILELCVLSSPTQSERNITRGLEPCLGLNKQTAELQTRLQNVSKVVLQIRGPRKLAGQTQSKRNFTHVLESWLVLHGGVCDANRQLQKVGGVMLACMYACMHACMSHTSLSEEF